MRLIALSLLVIGIYSCTGEASKMSQKEGAALQAGFNGLLDEFNGIYNNEVEKDSVRLVQINDSLKVYVDAMAEKDSLASELAQLYFLFGETSMKLKNAEWAIEYIDLGVQYFPTSDETPRALYNKAYTYENVLNDTEKALKTYKFLYKNYPDSKWAENAKSQVLYLNNPTFIGE